MAQERKRQLRGSSYPLEATLGRRDDLLQGFAGLGGHLGALRLAHKGDWQ